MQEGEAHKVTMSGVSALDIEAFLHYLYIGELPQQSEDSATPTSEEVLPTWSIGGLMDLTDMYGVQDLVRLVAEKAEQIVNADNVVEIVRAMNKRKADENVAPVYKRLRQRLRDDAELHEAFI